MFLFYYETKKEVKLLDRRLGLMNGGVRLALLLYIVGVRLWWERSYQATELGQGQVSVWLEGMTYSRSARDGRQYPADVPTLTRPGAEANALFVPTVVTTTADQVMHNCTDPAEPCVEHADCARLPPLKYGLCDPKGMCVTLGWCPRQELDSPRSAVSEVTALQDIERSFKEDIFLHVAAEITFPRLSPWKNKTFSTEDGRPARTRWPLYEVVARSGIPLAQAVRDGVYLSVVLAWSCNLNPGREPTSCIPMLRVYPVGGRSGFETSWAHHYQRATSSGYEERRDQHHAKGLRLLFRSKGSARKVDLYQIVLQLFVALALLPVASLLSDTIMQYAFAERRHYREYKVETTPDFSDVREKVEALEKQSKSQQEKLLAYS